MTEEEFKQIVKELQEFDNPPIEELLEDYKNKTNSIKEENLEWWNR